MVKITPQQILSLTSPSFSISPCKIARPSMEGSPYPLTLFGNIQTFCFSVEAGHGRGQQKNGVPNKTLAMALALDLLFLINYQQVYTLEGI